MKSQLLAVLGLIAILQLQQCCGQLCFGPSDQVITFIAKTGQTNSQTGGNNIAPMFTCKGGQLVNSAGTAIQALGQIVKCAVEGAWYTVNAINGLALQATNGVGDIVNSLGFDGNKYKCVNGQLIDTLGNVVRATGNVAGCLIEGAYYLVGDIGAGVVEGAGLVAGGIIQSVGNALGLGNVANGLAGVVIGTSNIGGTIIQGVAGFKAVVEGGAVRAVGQVGGDVVDTGMNLIGHAVGGTGQVLTDLSHGNVVAAVGDTVGTVGKGVGDLAGGAVKAVGDTVQGVGNIATGVVDVGAKTVQNVATGVSQVATGAVNAVSSVANALNPFKWGKK